MKGLGPLLLGFKPHQAGMKQSVATLVLGHASSRSVLKTYCKVNSSYAHGYVSLYLAHVQGV